MKKTMNSSNSLPPISSVIPCMMRMKMLSLGYLKPYGANSDFWGIPG